MFLSAIVMLPTRTARRIFSSDVISVCSSTRKR
jgi:hypothetical protein